jgi:NAD(P)-dependent dehydrogenase (short-subunit alcohol dehydrogenase family)
VRLPKVDRKLGFGKEAVLDIQNKKAVIVGGASGFGKATAEALAKRGARVAVLNRPNSAGQQVADAIGAAFHAVDVTDFASTE